MRITQVTVEPLVPRDHPAPSWLSASVIANPMSIYPEYYPQRSSWTAPFSQVLVRMTTDEGVMGMGVTGGGEAVRAIVRDHFSRLLIDQDPFDIEHNTRAFPFLGDSQEVSFTANTGGVKPHRDFLRSPAFFFRRGAMFPDHASRMIYSSQNVCSLEGVAVLDGYRFRRYPNPEQPQTLLRWIGCQRLIDNAKVQEDRYFRRFAQRMVGTAGQPVPVDQPYRPFMTGN